LQNAPTILEFLFYLWIDRLAKIEPDRPCKAKTSNGSLPGQILYVKEAEWTA
jgi:hypothetical protein